MKTTTGFCAAFPLLLSPIKDDLYTTNAMKSSLDTNPPNADRHITSGGSDWLWAVFAIMALADLGMIFWSFTVRSLFPEDAIASLSHNLSG